MQKAKRSYEKGNRVPFGMRFMEKPTAHDNMTRQSKATYTEKYTTQSGPSNALDDGQTVNSDD